jgi:hypothetical protein
MFIIGLLDGYVAEWYSCPTRKRIRIYSEKSAKNGWRPTAYGKIHRHAAKAFLPIYNGFL